MISVHKIIENFDYECVSPVSSASLQQPSNGLVVREQNQAAAYGGRRFQQV